jgi:hypothetical protein
MKVVLFIGGTWDGRQQVLPETRSQFFVPTDDSGRAPHDVYNRVTFNGSDGRPLVEVYALDGMTPDNVLRRLVEGYGSEIAPR